MTKFRDANSTVSPRSLGETGGGMDVGTKAQDCSQETEDACWAFQNNPSPLRMLYGLEQALTPQFFCTPPCLPLSKDNPTWVGLESIMLIEISQTQKDKHCMHHLYMKPKKKPNSLKQSRMVVTSCRGWWSHGDVVQRHKLSVSR